MKKIRSSAKLSNPLKLVRRVLSRTSKINKPKTEDKQALFEELEPLNNTKEMNNVNNVEQELSNLKKQISVLQISVDAMQNDAEQREKALSDVAREKQILCTDLRREKRSSTNLKKQLEDERKFYYKEKEQYCREMNKCKKLRRKMSEEKQNISTGVSKELLECKNEIYKLKDVLHQTLETNCNLSIKFLRMKNTKTYLKRHLEKQEIEHKEAIRDLQTKITNIKGDIAMVVEKRFSLPISPSHKKYLQTIKQNGILMHENLSLKMEVDRLTNENARLKAFQLESRKKIAFMKKGEATTVHETRNDKLDIPEQKSSLHSENGIKIKKITSTNRIKNIDNQKCEAIESKSETSKNNVVTIYERNLADGIPEIIMLQQSEEPNNLRPKPDNPHSVGISDGFENASLIYTDCSGLSHNSGSMETIRTQSAPEIVQTTLFVSKDKV